MIAALILTLIVFILFWIAHQYVISNSPFDPKIKWGFTAIAAIIAIVIIGGIWGVIPDENFGWHRHIN